MNDSNGKPPGSLFGCLFGGDSRTLEEQLESLRRAQEWLNAFDSAQLKLARSEPLNDWIN